MNDKTLTVNIQDQVGYITFTRSHVHHCMNGLFIDDLIQAIEALNVDKDARVIVLAATGKSFCAGADLNDMKKMAHYSMQENINDASKLAHLFSTLYHSPKPTLALVNGPAYGGGIGLVACCDLVIAADVATFCFSEVKLGLIPAVISPYIKHKLSISAIQRYFLTAELFDADTAKSLGLVHEVVKSEALAEKGKQIIQYLLKNSPHAITQAKQLIDTLTQTQDQSVLHEYTINAIANIRISEQGQEGLQAFFEKRKANWVK